MPEIKKYLSKDGLEDYNELLPHSATQMQEYVSDWLDEHPEATTTVQDGSINTDKLADGAVTGVKIADDTIPDAKLTQTGGVIEDVKNLTKGFTHLTSFVVGTLNSTGGIGWGPYAISSSEDMIFPYPVSLEIADGYQYLLLAKLNSADTYDFYGYMDVPQNLPANTPFKVTIRKTDDTSTPANIPVLARKLLITTEIDAYTELTHTQTEKLKAGTQLVDAFFERGTLQANTGIFFATTKYRVATPYINHADRTLTLHVNDGFKYGVHTYAADDTYIADSGWQTKDMTVAAGLGYKIVVARVTEDTSEIADVNKFRNAVSVDTQFTDEVNSVIGNVFNEPFMQPNKPMLVAHMGLHDATTNPENTLPAFKAAGAAGMWGIETDIQVTADGKYVCIHDTTLDRTTTGTGNVNEKTLAEIRELRIKDFPDLQVPTFEEYLGACKAYGCVPCIELKGTIPNTAESLVPIIEIIKRMGLYSKCILFGSKWRAVCVRDADNHIPYIGIFQHGAYADYASEIAFMKQFRRCGVALEVSGTITAEMIQECHAANMPVCAFVVDDNTAAYDWFAFGVDAITTNRITNL